MEGGQVQLPIRLFGERVDASAISSCGVSVASSNSRNSNRNEQDRSQLQFCPCSLGGDMCVYVALCVCVCGVCNEPLCARVVVVCSAL